MLTTTAGNRPKKPVKLSIAGDVEHGAGRDHRPGHTEQELGMDARIGQRHDAALAPIGQRHDATQETRSGATAPHIGHRSSNAATRRTDPRSAPPPFTSEADHRTTRRGAQGRSSERARRRNV
jgi:hypothetical protein